MFIDLKDLISSKTKFQNSFNLKGVLSLTDLTQKGYNWVQDCDLLYVLQVQT